MSNTMFNVVFFNCILTLGNSNLNSRKIHIEIFFVVNFYNKYWNFLLLKMWLISTVRKTTLYIVIFKFICFPL